MYLADIAGDFHMLAKTEGTPINTNKDELTVISMPSTIMPSTLVEAFIEYSANGKRDIKCYLKNASMNKLIAFDKVGVNTGSGVTSCDLNIPADTPVGDNYLLYTYMTKENGKWSERFDEKTKKPIKITALNDDLVSINIPSTIKTGSAVTAYINYSAKAKRDIKCYLKNAKGKLTAFDSSTVTAGIGSVEEIDGQVADEGTAAMCNFNVPANTPRGNYSLYTYMTKSKGKWSERFDEITLPIKIVLGTPE